MASDKIDPTRLAAFLDGKLSEVDRRQMIDELASEDDSVLGIVADASGLVAASSPEISRHLFRHFGERSARGFLLAAAAVVIIVGASFLVGRGPRAIDEPSRHVTEFLASAASADSIVWPVYRSGETPLSEEARGVRVGRLLADLRIVRSDSTRASIATALAELLRGAQGMSDVSFLYAQIGRGRVAPDSALIVAGEVVANRLGRGAVRTGEWLELIRTAARNGSATFLADRATRSAVLGMRGSVLSSAETQALDTLSSLLAGRSNDWRNIDSAATRLLTSLGR